MKRSIFFGLALSIFTIFSAYANDKPVWANDPVISSENCSSLKHKDVVSFLAKYFYPTLSYDSDQGTAGRQMMETYAIATSLTLRSQTCLAEALEIKGLTDKLKKEQALVSSGTSLSKKELKKQRKLSAEANEKIKSAASKVENLTPEQRKSFGLGTASYLAGAYATSELFKKIKNYGEETASVASGLSSGKGFGMDTFNKIKGTLGAANTVRVITSGLKDHTKSLYSTSKFLMDYSKKQKIDLPSDATSSLNSAVDWI